MTDFTATIHGHGSRYLHLTAPALVSLLLLIFTTSVVSRADDSNSVLLYAVGDVSLGRGIGNAVKKRGADYPFKETSSTLHEADIVLGNLESILGDTDDKQRFPGKPYNFIAPLDSAVALKQAGFDLLSLANNHALDYGDTAIEKTIKALGKAGILFFGAGKELMQARTPAVVTIRGIRFAFLAYGTGHSSKIYATAKRGGIAPIRSDYIKKDIAAMKGKADVVIVSLHWGFEYKDAPEKWQRDFAKTIIGWGADAVIGHHPHVLQGIELYKGKPIAYSLGNFLFDQKDDGTDRSVILALEFTGKTITGIGVIPLDRFNTYFPRAAKGQAKKEILKNLKKISTPLNAEADNLKRLGLE
ncbi:MAG: CapA family protein [Deltaproteobacteria bacterium]|nr:CapA family protein [Deltaproteobacteria bacterium]